MSVKKRALNDGTLVRPITITLPSANSASSCNVRRTPRPVVAPLKGDYPFAGLCGTGVVWKLAEALLGPEHPFLARHLDVVALATVADVVPLVGENRSLVIAGLRTLARTQRPGLRALMKTARVDPAESLRVE